MLPSHISFTHGERANEGVLTVEPCAQGYGTTLGNALRRVLLSSLSGAAVTAVKFKGADHEFATLPNVKEDVFEMILNLKALRVKLFSEEPVKLRLSVKGEKVVTAADFAKDALVEIVNPDLVIGTVTAPSGTLEMEVWVSSGRGYRSTDDRGKEKLELGMIAVDALFNPVTNVSYKVEATRVGDKIDFDKLTLNIETDGTIDPLEAANQAVSILTDHISLLKDLTYSQE